MESGTKLIVITDTTTAAVDTAAILLPGVTTKPRHSGLGLTNVRKILQKHDNCEFRLSYDQNVLSASIELAAPTKIA